MDTFVLQVFYIPYIVTMPDILLDAVVHCVYACVACLCI